MKRDIDMLKGNLAGNIILFSIPLVFSNLLQIIFNIADIAVVGKFVDSIALGSVGSTSMMTVLFTGLVIGIASGMNVMTAQSIGAERPDVTEETVSSSFTLSLFVGFLVLAAAELAGPEILALLHTKEELVPGALLYIRIYFLGLPALAVYNFGNAVFSAGGDTKKPLLFLSASGTINVILNLIFVLVLHRSVDGVAMASVIAQYLSAILVITALLRSEKSFRLVPALRLPDLKLSRKILAIGFPAGLQNAVFLLSSLFIQSGVNSFSADMVAGCAAAYNADAITFETITAFYIACSSFVGQNYGAGNIKRISKSYHLCLLYSTLTSLVLGILFVTLGRHFLALFTNEPAVISEGMRRLTIMGAFYFISPAMDCTISASRGIGKSAVPTVIVVMGSCIFRIIWIYTVFRAVGTPESLFAVFPVSWVLTGIAEVIYYRRSFRMLLAE